MKNFFSRKRSQALKKRFKNRKVQVNHKFINVLQINMYKWTNKILTQCQLMIHIRASENARFWNLAELNLTDS